MLLLFLEKYKSFALVILWSKTCGRWYFCFYFIKLVSFIIFLHLLGNCCIKFLLFDSSVALLLAHLMFVKFNFIIIIDDIWCLDIIPLFQFIFKSWERVIESCFSPRMRFLEHLIILIRFDVIRIVQLFQRSEFLINDRANKTCFVILFRENRFFVCTLVSSWSLLVI